MGTHTSSQTRTATPLTKNQWRGFLAAWGGWALDERDSYIFALVMVPALRELLPRSGMRSAWRRWDFMAAAFRAVSGGWDCAFLWGPIADKYGRVFTLMLTIIGIRCSRCGRGGTQVWQLGGFPISGGNWNWRRMGDGRNVYRGSVAGRRRVWRGAWMHTGYYFGIFAGGVANYVVGSAIRWRAMFVLGGAPALLVA